MSQMPADEAEEFFDPMNMDEYDEIHMDSTAGPSHQPSYNIRDGGQFTGGDRHGGGGGGSGGSSGYDEGFFSSNPQQQQQQQQQQPQQQQHHHKSSHHHRQNQQGDKTVDQDFFNDFPDDFDDEDLK
ncbi:hypothetical protein Glove_131g76 [Diversispora epigaea]|uniref:Uncharacterized protein n=1 Tax=Diversispora epigaea TaxID=1348612 RepID=A0A397J7A4_9GLOM|nr:hypothetical protein Glove_131g76 [Diversispora epigaea]